MYHDRVYIPDSWVKKNAARDYRERQVGANPLMEPHTQADDFRVSAVVTSSLLPKETAEGRPSGRNREFSGHFRCGGARHPERKKTPA